MNPWPMLAGLLLLIAVGVCGFFYGQHVGRQACKAGALDGVAGAVDHANKASAAVDAIGASTAANTAADLNSNRSATDESAARIRTVVVPGDCRRIDPVVLQELRNGRDEANAALRSGLRSIAAGADSADP